MASEAVAAPRNWDGGQQLRPDNVNLVFETSLGVEAISSFDQMGIRDDLLRGIDKPSAIQQRAILSIVSGRDVIAQAQSSTGKMSMIARKMCKWDPSMDLAMSLHVLAAIYCALGQYD